MVTGTTRGDIIGEDVSQIIRLDLPWESLSGRRILVTGASGMIPSYATRVLLALRSSLGIDVTVMAMVRNLSDAKTRLGEIAEQEGITMIEHDVGQPFSCLGPFDDVIHGASPTQPRLHTARPVDTLTANISGTLNALAVCKSDMTPRFVLMSSAEVYGGGDGTRELISEHSYRAIDPLEARSSYPVGKRAAEAISAAYNRQYGVETTLSRFGHIYGPGMRLSDPRVQAQFAADVLNKRNIVLKSAGDSMRTYTYVGDAVSGMFTAMLKGDNMPYNIAARSGFVSIRRLAETFVAARPEYGLRVVGIPASGRLDAEPERGQGLDSARVRALGWEATTSLLAGLRRFLEWNDRSDA